MRNVDALLKKTELGRLTEEEISYIVQRIKVSTVDNEDPNLYTLILILGEAGSAQHWPLVESFLNYPSFPMISAVSLQVLCDHWGHYQKYSSIIKRFVKGVEWDKHHDVWIIAVSCAGELLRRTADNPDKELLQFLIDILLDNEQEKAELFQECAYEALARAAGQEWPDILNDPNKPNPIIIPKIHQMLQMGEK